MSLEHGSNVTAGFAQGAQKSTGGTRRPRLGWAGDGVQVERRGREGVPEHAACPRPMTAGAESEAAARGATERLVVRARQGESAAFEELILEHSPRIYRLLVRMLGNAPDAEEVAQETFLKAWRALPGFRGEAQFSTWLFRIAVNEGNRRLAHDARQRALPIDDATLQIPDLGKGPASLAEDAELEAHLERLLEGLPAAYRAAVVLRDVEGLTNEEAAELLGLELTNFKSRLHRGRMGLRQRVEELYSST